MNISALHYWQVPNSFWSEIVLCTDCTIYRYLDSVVHDMIVKINFIRECSPCQEYNFLWSPTLDTLTDQLTGVLIVISQHSPICWAVGSDNWRPEQLKLKNDLSISKHTTVGSQGEKYVVQKNNYYSHQPTGFEEGGQERCVTPLVQEDPAGSVSRLWLNRTVGTQCSTQ